MASPSTRERLHTIEVVGLGQASIDYLGRVAFYPEEDGKVELMDLQMQCGGPASTALVTLSRLGVQTSFLGSVSDDAFGVEIVKGLKEERVDHHFLKITPGYASQFAFIAVNKEDGRRTVFWTRGSVPHLKSADVDLKPFTGAHILHTDGLMVEASIEGARQAKEVGLTVVMDAGTLREGQDADLVVVALDRPFQVDVRAFRSKARNCPFDGWSLKGQVLLTMVGGKVVYEEQAFLQGRIAMH